MSIGVSDHALLRFLERGGDLNVEGLRISLNASLERAHAAARRISGSDYLIRADGLVFVVRGETVTTVLNDEQPCSLAHRLEQRHP